MAEENSNIDTMARECLAVRMRLLNRVITNIYDRQLRPLGLKASQLNILVATAKMQLARPGDVCKALQLDVSTLSRNVDRMRAKGWIAVTDTKDGREHPFVLTPAGRALLNRAVPAWRRAQNEALKLLGNKGETMLDAATKRLKVKS